MDIEVKSARSLLEPFSRDRVLRPHLPGDFGSVPIFVSPDASLSFWKLHLESDLLEFASEFAELRSVVSDAGANVGLVSIATSRRAGASGKATVILGARPNK
jgi:hypothetical protein